MDWCNSHHRTSSILALQPESARGTLIKITQLLHSDTTPQIIPMVLSIQEIQFSLHIILPISLSNTSGVSNIIPTH